MTQKRAFKQVDVFTAIPLLGNPVAVVLDGDGLSDAQMQAVANWTNLSETTFVMPPTAPGADYRVRIFTPRSELPFAGHPTLGTAHALIESGIVLPREGRLVQECALGLVEVTVTGNSRSFRMPRHSLAAAPDVDSLIAAIGGGHLVKRAPLRVDVGPHWMIAELASAKAVETLAPDLIALAAYERAHRVTGLTVFAEGGAGDITVRSFAPSDGLIEDPVCGSGNGAVAAFRLSAGTVGDGDSYIASQGRQLGRDGRVDVRISGTDIHVGGACVTCIDGVFQI